MIENSDKKYLIDHLLKSVFYLFNEKIYRYQIEGTKVVMIKL